MRIRLLSGVHLGLVERDGKLVRLRCLPTREERGKWRDGKSGPELEVDVRQARRLVGSGKALALEPWPSAAPGPTGGIESSDVARGADLVPQEAQPPPPSVAEIEAAAAAAASAQTEDLPTRKGAKRAEA